MKKRIKTYSVYSGQKCLNMDIRDFTYFVKSEVKSWVNSNGGELDKDKVERCMSASFPVLVHLHAEKRIIKAIYTKAKKEHLKIENDALLIAQHELSSKATVREHKLYIHNEKGDELEERQAQIDSLEQKWKYLSDVADAVKTNQSTLQSILASMRVEWEASRG